MEFILSKNKLSLVFVLFLFVQCAQTNKAEGEEERVYPKINLNKDKKISVRISSCIDDFDESKAETKVLFSWLTDGDLKLLIGSKLSCEYRQGAYSRLIQSDKGNLHFKLFPTAERLSNECNCYFYIEVTVKDRSEIPEKIKLESKDLKINPDKFVTTQEFNEIQILL
ncbi:MAG: hypothetical protein ABF238_00200 [Flavobacteriales bacterium]